MTSPWDQPGWGRRWAEYVRGLLCWADAAESCEGRPRALLGPVKPTHHVHVFLNAGLQCDDWDSCPDVQSILANQPTPCLVWWG